MIYILLAALSSTSIFVMFKWMNVLKIPTITPIVINYIVAALLGFLISSNKEVYLTIPSQPWFYLSIIIGILFIVMFFFIGLSSQKVGISVTTVASKMSVVIPILFSIFYYNESVTYLKIISVVLAVVAVVLAVYKKQDKKIKTSLLILFLPLLLFVGLGMVDASVKFAQQDFVKPELVSHFTSVLFFMAFLTGMVSIAWKKSFWKSLSQFKVVGVGTLLGIVNYGSIYFIMLALNNSGIESSYVFGITNIAIVTLSVLIGKFIFKEILTPINWIGVLISITAIILMINA